MAYHDDRITGIPAPLATDYDRVFNFEDYQESNPNTPLPASQIEGEFNLIEQALDETQDRLRLIQRDDGGLKNKSVTVDALTDEAGRRLGRARAWASGEAYRRFDLVWHSRKLYNCTEGHTAGQAFSDDSDKWELLVDVDGVLTDAESARSDAKTYRDDAEKYMLDAEQYAQKPEDTEIIREIDGATDGYSSIHHRAKAEAAKTAAETAESNAATSESTTLDYLKTFRGQYWGAFSSDPATDADGNGPDAGDLYFNTTDGELQVYDAVVGDWLSAAIKESEVVLVDGSNVMEAALDMDGNQLVNLGAPGNPSDAATKSYVDSAINGLDWQESVIDQQNDPPSSPSDGDRYLAGTAPTGAWSGHAGEIATWDADAAAWAFIAPDSGTALERESDGRYLIYNGSSWVKFGSAIDHNVLSTLQGGAAGEYYHLTATEQSAIAAAVSSGDNSNINADQLDGKHGSEYEGQAIAMAVALG